MVISVVSALFYLVQVWSKRTRSYADDQHKKNLYIQFCIFICNSDVLPPPFLHICEDHWVCFFVLFFGIIGLCWFVKMLLYHIFCNVVILVGQPSQCFVINHPVLALHTGDCSFLDR